MEVTEAPEIPHSDSSELEVVDLSTEITKDIETGKKPKKERFKLKLVHLLRYSSAFPRTRTRTAFPSVM